MTIYRVTKAKYADTAFSGYGSMQVAGRWHEAGVPVVYASDSVAGALLEVLVHTEAAALLGHAYVYVRVELDPERHLLVLEEAARPTGWDAAAWPRATQRIGTRWCEDRDSAVLQVPSAVVPEHHNYLLNPRHPHFKELVLGEVRAFRLDPRLGR